MPDGTWDPKTQKPSAPDLAQLLAALYEPEQLATLAEALGGGSFPGVGIIENDTMDLVDSVGPGYPLNIPFLLPTNMVKHQHAWLSFKLLPYRQYVSAVTSSGSGFVTSGFGPPAGAVTGWSTANNVVNSLGTVGTHTHTDPQGGSTGATSDGAFAPPAGTVNGVMYNPTTTNVMGYPPPTGTAVTSVTLVQGIVEGTSATGVSVLVDGTDYTSQLGGPFNSDTFELDLTALGWAKTSGIHTCQLTSTQLGRIVGWVRNNYIVNPFK